MACAVTAAWLLVTSGSGHTLIRDGARQRLRAFSALSSLGEEVSPSQAQAEDVLSQLEGAAGPRSFAFEQRCRGLDDGDRLCLTYRALSAQAHSGLGIADFYSVAVKESKIGLAFSPDAASRVRTPTVGLASCMLLLAVNAHELARARPAHVNQIAAAARELGIGTRIVAADGSELPLRARKI